MDPGKPGIRRALHDRLRITSPEERVVWSVAIRGQLSASNAWSQAKTVMLFAALRFEPDLVPLLESTSGKRLVFPALEDDVIVARLTRSPLELIPSGSGIREPVSTQSAAVPAAEIDLVCVPGLAFDLQGNRLGRGKGHYDRFLAGLPARTVRCGVCFDCQWRDAVPAEGHDIPMNAVLTETGWHRIKPLDRPPGPSYLSEGIS